MTTEMEINNYVKDNKLARIMVVDDEKDILRIIKRDLEVTNEFQVEVFSSGIEALTAFKNHELGYYAVIITDIRMPRMNGFELYRQIKEMSPNTKIAFITAFEINKDEFIKVLPSIEVKDFIIKPIDMDDLIFKIKSMLSM
ncbi:MAG TPA: response regulator [Candidatus Sulfopaludibacter sp.]|jgi:DNA-binding response OmpR family regulator|nr:response regulator [Candidatus Sulfopaludibacter sp.]